MALLLVRYLGSGLCLGIKCDICINSSRRICCFPPLTNHAPYTHTQQLVAGGFSHTNSGVAIILCVGLGFFFQPFFSSS